MHANTNLMSPDTFSNWEALGEN